MTESAPQPQEGRATRGVPDVSKNRYECPHPDCGAFSQHRHGDMWFRFEGDSGPAVKPGWMVHLCTACGKPILWRVDESANWTMTYPSYSLSIPPNPDMPDVIRRVYEEALAVATLSRRSAAALLRLALQLLVDEVAPGPGDVNSKIGRLVTAGLHPQTQQSMDVLRVVGNNAVHPGQIDLDDRPELVPSLFVLVNLVVDELISRPNHARALYDSLPENARAAVERRDGTASGG